LSWFFFKKLPTSIPYRIFVGSNPAKIALKLNKLFWSIFFKNREWKSSLDVIIRPMGGPIFFSMVSEWPTEYGDYDGMKIVSCNLNKINKGNVNEIILYICRISSSLCSGHDLSIFLHNNVLKTPLITMTPTNKIAVYLLTRKSNISQL
jgi:hypothetical protein